MSEFLKTYFTLIGLDELIAEVQLFMRSKICLVGKCLITQVTCMSASVCVNFLVNGKIAWISKGFVTYVTFIGTLIRMGSHVCFQSRAESV